MTRTYQRQLTVVVCTHRDADLRLSDFEGDRVPELSDLDRLTDRLEEGV